MAILNLDKIKIDRPGKGISCMQCGGELKEIGKLHFFDRIFYVLRFGRFKPRRYQCMDCKKKYHVI